MFTTKAQGFKALSSQSEGIIEISYNYQCFKMCWACSGRVKYGLAEMILHYTSVRLNLAADGNYLIII